MSANHFTADCTGSSLALDELGAALAAGRIGKKFHYFAEVASTNAHARALAKQGAAESEIVIAEAQSQGRGRLGRRWQSPPYANLYFSVILRPKLAPADAPQITLMAAVAVVETVGSFIPQTANIKWPNDILVDGKKLAGILTEAALTSERVEYVILGIGVNLNYRVDQMAEEIRARATSIAELTGKLANRESFLGRLIQALDRCYGELEESGFEPMARRWSAHFALLGRRVRVELLDQVVSGRARGIDRDGALVIEDETGARHRVIAGDVIPLEC